MDGKRTILLADDAAMFRELGALFLARTGRVVTANNGYQGLDAIRRQRPDVVVADLDMPCMSGDELCRRLKADPELRDIPVILVTSSERAEDRARAVRAGADDVIAKPISRISLIQAVNRFLRAGSVRGLVRVPLETDVRIRRLDEELWGHALNLSRGGLFVEAPCPMPPETEVKLDFRLPGSGLPLAPTAQVIWRRVSHEGGRSGMGLQFLALDRESAHEIDTFVYERGGASAPPGTAVGGER
jgi:uncharacterized protein (TIGR02266 family)